MILVGPFSSNSESSVKQTLVFNQCLQLLTVIYIALNYIFPYTLWVITTVYKSCIHLFYLCFTENLKTLVPPVFCSWDWFADIHFLYFHLFTYSPWKLLGGSCWQPSSDMLFVFCGLLAVVVQSRWQVFFLSSRCADWLGAVDGHEAEPECNQYRREKSYTQMTPLLTLHKSLSPLSQASPCFSG